MKWIQTMYFVLILAVITSTMAGPVRPSLQDADNTELETETKKKDETAEELEDLSHKDAVQDEPSVVPGVVPDVVPDVADATIKNSKRSQFATTINRQVIAAAGAFPLIPQQAEPESSFGKGQVDLSPRAIAEYLLVTRDFEGLDQALQDLIQAQVLTSQEVAEYRNAVSWQFEALLNQVSDLQQQYLQDLSRIEEADNSKLESDYFNLPENPAQAYPQYVQYEDSQNHDIGQYPELSQYLRTEHYSDLGQYPDLGQDHKLGQYPDLRLSPELGQYPDLGQYLELAQDPELGQSDYPQYVKSPSDLESIIRTKQETLEGILDVILNQYYNKPQMEPQVDFKDDYVTDYNQALSQSYSQTSAEDLDQLMALLQEEQNEEQEEQNEEQEEQNEEQNEGQDETHQLSDQRIDSLPNDIEEEEIVNELNSLPSNHAEVEDTEYSEETSGDDDDRTANETKTKTDRGGSA